MASSVLPVRRAGRSPPLSSCRNWIDELDVANAAVAGFDVAAVGPFAAAALLDAALEGLDAGDVGQAQIAAIDPRFELVEKLAAPVRDRRPRAGL